jgi:hypothetical protein
MTARNDITGDAIQTRINSESFRDNFDRIFRKKSPIADKAQISPKDDGACVACGCQLEGLDVGFCQNCLTR